MDRLTELANARMPFGKYKGWYLTDMPDAYYVWFSPQGVSCREAGRDARGDARDEDQRR